VPPVGAATGELLTLNNFSQAPYPGPPNPSFPATSLPFRACRRVAPRAKGCLVSAPLAGS
jgi:hypothetical protein